jgi:hypothetical protein
MKAMGSSVVCDRQEGEVEAEEGGDFAPNYEQGSDSEGGMVGMRSRVKTKSMRA